jgi:hypothetical protein
MRSGHQVGAEPPLAQGIDISKCPDCKGAVWLAGNKKCKHEPLFAAVAAAVESSATESEKKTGATTATPGGAVATAVAASPYGTLDASHFAFLSSIGVSADVIAARQPYTVTEPVTLKQLGFSRSQYSGADRLPGLLLPVHTTDGGNGLSVYRPDVPRTTVTRGSGAGLSISAFEIPAGMALRLDCPPPARRRLPNTETPLWIVDSQIKADALVSRGFTAVAMLGAWGFKGKNAWGAPTWLCDWDWIGLTGRAVRVVLDSAAMHKSFPRLSEHLTRAKAIVERVPLPDDLADWLIEKGTDALALLEGRIEVWNAPAAEPAPTKPAATTIAFMDAPPPRMERPLGYWEGHGHAAVWLHVMKETTEETNEAGEIVKLTRPRREHSREMFVVRDDGEIFGPTEGFDDPSWQRLEDLGVEVAIGDLPARDDRFWSTPSMKAFRGGYRPDPVDLHRRMTDVIDRFMDFDLGFGSQRAMAEMCAAWAMATWFTDAFDVVGYLWAGGGFESGKTQLIVAVAKMSFLGQVLLNDGSSVAGLRDLASAGATLAFDDAEKVAKSAANSDRDDGKRNMLLAGNARDSIIVVNGQTPSGGWKMRFISNFAPRLFSAITEPDEILRSRVIRVPLVRSADPHKSKALAQTMSLWPHPLGPIVDDCWILGLMRQAEIRDAASQVSEKSALSGRALDIWRGILTLALWLDAQGAKGLWRRMEALSLSYQGEKAEEPLTDINPVVVRAVFRAFERQTANRQADSTDSTDSTFGTQTLPLRTSEITEEVNRIVRDEELPFDAGRLLPERIGRILSGLRYSRDRLGKNQARCWVISRERILNDLKRYRIETP